MKNCETSDERKQIRYQIEIWDSKIRCNTEMIIINIL